MPSEPDQLDLLALLEAGAAELLAEAPALGESPEVMARLRRVLGEPLACRSVIVWRGPGCGARVRSDRRCGPGCPACTRPQGPRVSVMLRQIPRVPVRHWVLTLPRPMRSELAGDPAIEARLARAFARAIFGRLRARCGAPRAGCGAIVVAHRCGSALDLGLHLHAIVVDGVFVGDAAEPRFVGAPPGEDHGVIEPVLSDIRGALARCPGPASVSPALAVIRGAAPKRRRPARGPGAIVRRSGGAAVEASGVEVFRGEAIAADDRGALRRLCEYLARPPVARLVGLEVSPDQVTLALPPRPDGATQVMLSSQEVVAGLVASTPSGPAISTRSYGALAPRAARLRHPEGDQLGLVDVDGAKATAVIPRRRRARTSSPKRPLCPRCERPLEAIEVEDAVDARWPGGSASRPRSWRR